VTDTTTDVLAARLSALEDERAVLKTLYAYGHSIDYGDEDQWIDCFTADGVFDVRRRLNPDARRRHEGRDALAVFVAQHTRAPHAWHKHLLMEPDVTVDGDRARCRSYFLRVDYLDGAPVIVAMGRYLDELVRGDDGVWRFTRRVAEVENK